MERLLDLDDDYIRAVTGVRFTHPVVKCSRLGSELVLGLSIIRGCLNGNTISQDFTVPPSAGRHFIFTM